MKSNGVSSYKKGKTEVEINFPNGDIACRWCWLFLKYEENYKRYSCRLTSEWILDVELYWRAVSAENKGVILWGFLYS